MSPEPLTPTIPLEQPPVLIIGGSGVVGAQAARTLRRFHPALPITIGGRQRPKAQAIADEIGRAEATSIDLSRADLGLAAHSSFSAVVVFLKDDTLNSLRYAQARGLPYISVSSGIFEIGPETAFHIERPARAPILLASHWLAGAATLPALHLADDFQTIDEIEIGAVLDEQDMGGPAAYADFERLTKVTSRVLMLKNGRWIWAGGADAKRSFRTIDGMECEAQAYSPYDVLSLAAATSARSVRFDLVYGESASRRRGEAYSTEIAIEISGVLKRGGFARVRQDIVHPAGQAPLTALFVVLGVERLLGLTGGAPVAPGLYFPDVVIDPARAVQKMVEFGAQLRRT